MKIRKLKSGFYGKLPFHKEYVRTGDIRSETRALENFLHGGDSEKAARSDVPARGPLSTVLFLFSPPKGRRILAGSLRPSTDGLRSFPIAHFCHLRRRTVAKHYALVPLLLEELWEASDAFLARDFSGLQQFRDEGRQLEIIVPGNFSSAREAFIGRMKQSRIQDLPPPSTAAQDTKNAWNLRVFRNLFTAAGIERAQGGRGDITLAFWLPVHGSRRMRLTLTAFWLQVLDLALGRPRSLPSVFVSNGVLSEETPGLFIVFRPVLSSDFVCVMRGSPESDTISDLTADWGRVGEDTLLTPALEQALQDPETTLAALLPRVQPSARSKIHHE